MCGIAGLIHYQNAGRVDEAALRVMRDSMEHRGPDGSGMWISADGRVGLAHRRLSIVDLNAEASQPMTNEDGSIRVTFNGEIYNHAGLRRELIAQGHIFRTDHSDTEVLLHGLEQWGLEGLVQRISGDYGFALWDGRQQVLSLVRDRVGVKPLYFSMKNGVLLFASEIKAILTHPLVSRDIDLHAMYHYLSFLTTPAPMTMFKGIYKLPAGNYLQVSPGGGIITRRYWDALPGRGIASDTLTGMGVEDRESFYVQGIRKRLEESVAERMMSDVPVGVFLSGGIDSSTNVALMSRSASQPVRTFTVGFSDHQDLNELEYARLVAREFKTDHHEVLIHERDMMGYLEDLVYSQDEPLADWVCIPLYFVSKLARQHGVTVVQVGEGSDEQFCGYGTYMAYLRLQRRYWGPFTKLMPQQAQRGIAWGAKQAARLARGLEPYADIVDRAARGRECFWSGATAFWDIMKDELVDRSSISGNGIPEELVRSGMLPATYFETDSLPVVRSYTQVFDQHGAGDMLTRMIYNEFKLRLPELLLMRVDKVAMSVSLEARVPFLAHSLVEFTMDIPMKWKIRGNTPKYLLKQAVRGLIPDAIIDRRKMDFTAPMAKWLRGNFGEEARQRVLGSALLDRGYLDRSYIRNLFSDHGSGRRDMSKYLWAMVNLTSWYDLWIQKRTVYAA